MKKTSEATQKRVKKDEEKKERYVKAVKYCISNHLF
jgi:hypothetical protein